MIQSEKRYFRRHFGLSYRTRAGGFVLVATLSLMALLVLLVMALLGLSSASQRKMQVSRAEDEARANARLALSLALGQLQVEMGPDQRVSALADQIPGADPSTTGASVGRTRWTGVYDAWDQRVAQRPQPRFRSWLVSGERQALTRRETAQTDAPLGSVPTGRPGDVSVVGTGTAGNRSVNLVNAPLLAVKNTGAVGWWTGDENVKAMVLERSNTPDTSVAGLRGRVQASPRKAIELAVAEAGVLPFRDFKSGDPRATMIFDWPQAALVAQPPGGAPLLFHDLTTFGGGMLTNVRAGGFRRDLSLHLETTAAARPKEPLYRVGGEVGINMEEIWAYYHLERQLRSSGLPAFTTGGRGSGPWLEMAVNADTSASDPFFYLKNPPVIGVQTIYSLEATPAPPVNGQPRNRLRLVVDPVLVFWNPLDVAVSIPLTAFQTMKYWQQPFTLRLTIGRRVISASVRQLLTQQAGGGGDRNWLSVHAGRLQPLVLRPGEVLMVSQAARTATEPFNLGGRHRVDTVPGFNYGGGLAVNVIDPANGGAPVDLLPGETVRYEILPNTETSGGSGGGGHSSGFSITHHEHYVGLDRGANSTGIGAIAVDWNWGNRRVQADEIRAAGAPGSKGSPRMVATSFPQVFKGVTASRSRPLSSAQLLNRKEPVMVFGFHLKTETNTSNPGRFTARFNPSGLHHDFYDLSPAELQSVPMEIICEPLDSWRSPNIEVSTNGNAYHGGGRSAADGVNAVITHAVPRQPIVSLGALQHSMANGFNFLSPKAGSAGAYAANNSREPLYPQIGHAIGNSMAPVVLPPGRTDGTLPGGRPAADHSFLANQALFDDWFFSGVAPQTAASFVRKRQLGQVARDFFLNGEPLPNIHYRPRLGKEDAAAVLRLLVQGDRPLPDAAARIAAYLTVQGMFNVNSTSVEAWKSVLGGLKGQRFVTQGTNGQDRGTDSPLGTFVAGLGTPLESHAETSTLTDPKTNPQWVGYRTIGDEEIAMLAEEVVREIRRRGPFLSLADFVNRRPGDDRELARAGTLQAALDSTRVPINRPYNQGGRQLPPGAGRALVFPEAEAGPAAYGIPGVVKQADLLTPIAPILSARSDTFRIRAYGEKTTPGGAVQARAWCEAVVERLPEFVDERNRADESFSRLVPANQRFGRRFRVISFRWLSPQEV